MGGFSMECPVLKTGRRTFGTKATPSAISVGFYPCFGSFLFDYIWYKIDKRG